jgi:hypothetical protein
LDPNLNTALKWAEEIGLPPALPKSLEYVDQRAKLVDHICKLIQNSFLHELDAKEKDKRLNDITELSRQFISDVNDDHEIKNSMLQHSIYVVCLRLAYWHKTLRFPYFSFPVSDLARSESVEVCPYNTLLSK